MDKRLMFITFAVFTGTFCWMRSVYSGDAAKPANVQPLIVQMEEISVFDVPDNASRLWSGQRVSTWGKGRSKVKTWPVLKSSKPLCGELPVDMDGDGERERKLSFAIDESRGTGTGYDRMYFDINGDKELANNEVLNIMKRPPAKLMKRSSSYTRVVFETFRLAFGADGDKRIVEIIPSLTIYDRSSSRVYFIPSKCWRGLIVVNEKEYHVYLGSNYDAVANYDSPETGLYIAPAEDPKAVARWPGGYSLNSTHNLGGRFCNFSATPRGDKLTVVPYAGDVGVFRIGAGGRELKGELKMSGSLASEKTFVAVGGEFNGGWPEWANECLVPVGDYFPDFMRARFGGVEVLISDNYHTTAEVSARTGRSRVYGIEIRKDKPYVLDFSNEPEVKFTTVKRGMEVRPGQELEINAVLIDPKLNIMVRGISEIRQDNPAAGGKSLEPKVLITRGNGEVVGEGVMPFG